MGIGIVLNSNDPSNNWVTLSTYKNNSNNTGTADLVEFNEIVDLNVNDKLYCVIYGGNSLTVSPIGPAGETVCFTITPLQTLSGGGGGSSASPWNMFLDCAFGYSNKIGTWNWISLNTWPGHNEAIRYGGWIQSGNNNAADELDFDIFLSSGSYIFRFLYIPVDDGGTSTIALGNDTIGTLSCVSPYDFGQVNTTIDFVKTVTLSNKYTLKIITSSAGFTRLQAIYVLRFV